MLARPLIKGPMTLAPVILGCSLAALTGCSTISSSLGLERHVPDETQVAVHPGLTLPPDYDLMPPGTPSAVSGEHETAAEAAASAPAPKEERGFFSSMVHGFGLFDSDDSAKTTTTTTTKTVEDRGGPTADINGIPQTPPPDRTPAAPASATPAQEKGSGPDVNGTPQPDTPATTPQQQSQTDKPGFFSKLFDWF